MEPRIQYAKTSDGVNIAYRTQGEGGTPLVMTSPLILGNISLEWQVPELRRYAEHEDNMPHEEYVAWQRSALTAMMRILRPDGAIFLCPSPVVLVK